MALFFTIVAALLILFAFNALTDYLEIIKYKKQKQKKKESMQLEIKMLCDLITNYPHKWTKKTLPLSYIQYTTDIIPNLCIEVLSYNAYGCDLCSLYFGDKKIHLTDNDNNKLSKCLRLRESNKKEIEQNNLKSKLAKEIKMATERLEE